ncbi:MAG: hypothetical protein P4M11_05120 [Candidatus Pacebacteria bacterium]|nr:hypothetical protein [Candidatus Paceibacterota bacterium]
MGQGLVRTLQEGSFITFITILMTSSHFWSFARRAAAPLATFISGLAIVTTFALPATALAAPLPTPSFTTAITVAPATSTYDGTATLSATLSGSVTLLTHTYSIPLPNQTLSFSIGSHSVGVRQRLMRMVSRH